MCVKIYLNVVNVYLHVVFEYLKTVVSQRNLLYCFKPIVRLQLGHQVKTKGCQSVPAFEPFLQGAEIYTFTTAHHGTLMLG